ncbi:MAG: DegT/DnrJ/EryC1/StrS aminotransferase family protein [Fischerella sp.]|nr:DegT/DnrJ/EryC1/StrS aminotransferase family protein [Fischerella sp.]
MTNNKNFTYIPFSNIKKQYSELRQELLDITDEIYKSGEVIDGEYTKKLEAMLAERCHRLFCVTFNSNSMALLLTHLAFFILKNNGQEKNKIAIASLGDRYILNSVLMSGNQPCYVDVDKSGCLDTTQIVPNSVTFVVATNKFGNMVDFDLLEHINIMFQEKPFIIIEDASESFGSKYNDKPSGSFGIASILCFDKSSILPNYGTGGAVLTNNYNLYRTLKSFRENGGEDTDRYGVEARLSEVDCAQLTIKLNYFDAWRERRQKIAEYYNKNISNKILRPPLTEGVQSCFSSYPLLVYASRPEFKKILMGDGIEVNNLCNELLHTLESNQTLTFSGGVDLYNTTKFSKEGILLPIYPELTDVEVEYIVEKVNAAVEKLKLSAV